MSESISLETLDQRISSVEHSFLTRSTGEAILNSDACNTEVVVLRPCYIVGDNRWLNSKFVPRVVEIVGKKRPKRSVYSVVIQKEIYREGKVDHHQLKVEKTLERVSDGNKVDESRMVDEGDESSSSSESSDEDEKDLNVRKRGRRKMKRKMVTFQDVVDRIVAKEEEIAGGKKVKRERHVYLLYFYEDYGEFERKWVIHLSKYNPLRRKASLKFLSFKECVMIHTVHIVYSSLSTFYSRTLFQIEGINTNVQIIKKEKDEITEIREKMYSYLVDNIFVRFPCRVALEFQEQGWLNLGAFLLLRDVESEYKGFLQRKKTVSKGILNDIFGIVEDFEKDDDEEIVTQKDNKVNNIEGMTDDLENKGSENKEEKSEMKDKNPDEVLKMKLIEKRKLYRELLVLLLRSYFIFARKKKILDSQSRFLSEICKTFSDNHERLIDAFLVSTRLSILPHLEEVQILWDKVIEKSEFKTWYLVNKSDLFQELNNQMSKESIFKSIRNWLTLLRKWRGTFFVSENSFVCKEVHFSFSQQYYRKEFDAIRELEFHDHIGRMKLEYEGMEFEEEGEEDEGETNQLAVFDFNENEEHKEQWDHVKIKVDDLSEFEKVVFITQTRKNVEAFEEYEKLSKIEKSKQKERFTDIVALRNDCNSRDF